VGLVDEWASRFFEELDYINEGENGSQFAEMMRKDLPQVSTTTFFVFVII
jgi:aarF domain-containing kinase